MRSISVPHSRSVLFGRWRSRRYRSHAARKPILLVALWPRVTLDDAVTPPHAATATGREAARLPLRKAIPLVLLLSAIGWAGVVVVVELVRLVF